MKTGLVGVMLLVSLSRVASVAAHRTESIETFVFVGRAQDGAMLADNQVEMLILVPWELGLNLLSELQGKDSEQERLIQQSGVAEYLAARLQEHQELIFEAVTDNLALYGEYESCRMSEISWQTEGWPEALLVKGALVRLVYVCPREVGADFSVENVLLASASAGVHNHVTYQLPSVQPTLAQPVSDASTRQESSQSWLVWLVLAGGAILVALGRRGGKVGQ